MSGLSKPPRRVITDKPGRWEWRPDPSQLDLEDSTVDRDLCFTCQTAVGFSLDGDDRVQFSAYLISPDGYRRYCEDCSERRLDALGSVAIGEPGDYHEALAKARDEFAL